jgi:hypothetical protein
MCSDTAEVVKGGDACDRFQKGHYTMGDTTEVEKSGVLCDQIEKFITRKRYNRGGKGWRRARPSRKTSLHVGDTIEVEKGSGARPIHTTRGRYNQGGKGWRPVGPNRKRLLHAGDTTEVEKGGDARGRFENGHYTRAIQQRWKRVATCGAESKKMTTGRRYNRGGKG